MVLHVQKLWPSASALVVMTAGVLAYTGCSSDVGTAIGVTHPTMIEVAPADFLGVLSCSNEESSVQRYVATVFDVTDEGAGGAGGSDWLENVDFDGIPICGGFQLPSSEPTPCLASVGFGFVVPGRRYCVEVDAYDTDQIEPRGTGTRKMVVVGDAEDAQPAPLAERRWHTACEGAMATPATIVRAGGCLPLFPQPAATALANVRVDLEALLGDLECGSEPGQVERFDVGIRYEGKAVGVHQQPVCGVDPDPVFEVPGGISVSAEVFAYQGRHTLAGATCRAFTVPGTTVVAECTKLSQLGTLRVDLEAELETLGFACDDSISDVRVTIVNNGVLDESSERSLAPPDCLEPFDHGFGPGEGEVSVEVFHEGTSVVKLTCTGVVDPGKLVVAQCVTAMEIPAP